MYDCKSTGKVGYCCHSCCCDCDRFFVSRQSPVCLGLCLFSMADSIIPTCATTFCTETETSVSSQKHQSKANGTCFLVDLLNVAR